MKAHLKILCDNKTIVIKCKPNHQMFYLIGFNVKPKVYAAETVMDRNLAHEKLGVKKFHAKQSNFYKVK